jgi:hypothetical protein
MADIVLLPHQIDHFQNIADCFRHNLFALDTSKMGCGKTYVSSKVLTYYGFKHCIVVCPSIDVWEEVRDTYQLPIDYIITYHTLRSRKGSQPTHGLLSRFESKEEGPMFTPTELYRTLIKEGCLLIFDESHLIKNDSDQFKAARALSRAITLPTDEIVSRVLFLSATPFDKTEQPTRLLQCAGVISQNKLYSYDIPTRRYEITGLKELITFCKIKNAMKTQILATNTSYNKETIPILAYELYKQIIQESISFCMPIPQMQVELDCKNGYYKMTQIEEDNYIAAISRLNSAVKGVNNEVKINKDNLGAVTLALIDKEYAKCGTYIRNAIWTLENIPNSKVVISVNFNRTINTLMLNLAKYKPLLYNGQLSAKKRTKVKGLFQQVDLEHRLLITNINVSSLSVSFDDRDGNFPRYAFGEAGYKIMNDHQWTHRFYRISTRSVPHVRFVYGNVVNKTTGEDCGLLEGSIISSIQRKSQVMKDTLKVQVEEGVKFPSDYEKEIIKEILVLNIFVAMPLDEKTLMKEVADEIHNLLVIEDDNTDPNQANNNIVPLPPLKKTTHVPQPQVQENEECVICRTNKRQYIILPCCHYCLCTTCSQIPINDCPLCREKINKINKVY